MFNAEEVTRLIIRSHKELLIDYDESVDRPIIMDWCRSNLEPGKPKPKYLFGYKIDWAAKTVSVPQQIENCGIYTTIENSAKELGLNIQLAAL